VNIILHSSDVSLFGKILDSEISTIKKEFGDDSGQNYKGEPYET